ncbi:hypothetical protein BU16DRAFT_562127 [Lophium mytilinum]|uniref:Uncharacterized protein n=1 Tax=Lophium mytilinum TaxID=390894 RepID=A0A6A6QRU0_9PEZI|nr:hypothetical protein BU16DRAFT_562127 [Lophium mytilinum]
MQPASSRTKSVQDSNKIKSQEVSTDHSYAASTVTSSTKSCHPVISQDYSPSVTKPRLRLLNTKLTKPEKVKRSTTPTSYSAAVSGSRVIPNYPNSLPATNAVQEETSTAIADSPTTPLQVSGSSYGFRTSLSSNQAAEVDPLETAPAVQTPLSYASVTRPQLGDAGQSLELKLSIQRGKALTKLKTWTKTSDSTTNTGIPGPQQNLIPRSRFKNRPIPDNIRRFQKAAEEAAASGTLLSCFGVAGTSAQDGPNIGEFEPRMVISFTMKVPCTDPRLKLGDPGVILTKEGLMLIKQRFGHVVQKSANSLKVIPWYTHGGEGIAHLSYLARRDYAGTGVQGIIPKSLNFAPGDRLWVEEGPLFNLGERSYARVSEYHIINFGTLTPFDRVVPAGYLTPQSFEESIRRHEEALARKQARLQSEVE